MSIFEPEETIRKSLSVQCSIDTAFQVWVEGINTWWPKGHSRSGNQYTQVFMESGVGGRLYERTPEGTEYDWGKVTAWEPPSHFAWHWYLGSGPEQPTQVDVHFAQEPGGSTRVEVVHRGPELIGQLWSRNNAVYNAAWQDVLTAYLKAIDNSVRNRERS